MALTTSRIREDGSASLRRLVASASLDEPTAAQLAALAATLPLTPAPLPVAPAPAAAAGLGVKVFVACALLGGVALAVALTSLGAPPPAPPAVQTAPPDPAPAPTGQASPPAVAQPAVPSAPQPTVRPPAPRPRHAEPDRPSELVALNRAFEALQRSDPAAALEAVGAHELDFPRGAMIEEREVLRVRALVALGRAEEAQVRLDELATRFPESGHLESLRALLAQHAR